MDTKLKELYVVNQNKNLLNAISLKYPKISGTVKLMIISILNTLIILFNVKKDDVSKLLDELLLLYSRNIKDEELNKSSIFQKKIFSYLTNAHNDSYPLINELVNNYKNRIINNDMNYYLDNKILLLSNMYLCNNKELVWNYDNLFNLVNNLYNNSENSTLYFSNIKAGVKKGPFASNGNYSQVISLIINVKEFYENGNFYIIDLLNRNLDGENRNKINYNLTNISDYYDIKRINRNILKILCKKEWINLTIEEKNKLLYLLKLEGNGYLFIENDEGVKKVLDIEEFDEMSFIPKKIEKNENNSIEAPIKEELIEKKIEPEIVKEEITNITPVEEVKKENVVNNINEGNIINEVIDSPKKDNSLLIVDIFIGILIIAIILVAISMFKM